ncbi:MAG: putative transport system permease protein [Verrucomicrobiota bacterium]
MKLRDLIAGAGNLLVQAKLRSSLTMIGIGIGVTGIVGVATATTVLRRTIGSELVALGGDYVRVIPYRDPTKLSVNTASLEPEDGFAVVRTSDYVEAFNPIYSSTQIVQANAIVEQGTVYGVGDKFQAIHRYDISVGRFFDESEERSHSPVAIVGAELARDLALGPFPVGMSIIMGTTQVTVIGVFEPIGTSIFSEAYDRAIVMPITTVLDIFGQPARDGVVLEFKARTAEDVSKAEEEIATVLRKRRGLTPSQNGGFLVLKQSQLLDSINSLVLVTGAVGAGMVGLSLVVGGVGIMNIMLVSVRERVVEIGLRKAIGATKRDILVQFLTEAVLLCLGGGLLGLVLAISSTHLVCWLIPKIKDVSIPGWSLLIALGFSAMTGLIFGTYPAVQAASLEPVEALRRDT